MNEESISILTGYFIVLIPLALIVYLRKKKESKEINRLSDLPHEQKHLELVKMQANMEKFKTNHILHLLLAIFTFSIWIIPWFFIAQSNKSKRQAIEKLIKNM